MSEPLREQLSALMDGELPNDQLRFLLRRIDADAALANCWSRYQMAGAVLRKQAAIAPLRAGFSEHVLRHVGRLSAAARILRWTGGGAVAAAVAVLALVSTRPAGELPAPTPVLAAVSTPAQAARTRSSFLPIAPSFDYAQPASFDTGLIRLPRYDLRARYSSPVTWPEPQANSPQTQPPYVLLLQPAQQQADASATPRHN